VYKICIIIILNINEYYYQIKKLIIKYNKIFSHTKEPTFTYFENTNEPIRIKLGNISAIYSNKKWKIGKY